MPIFRRSVQGGDFVGDNNGIRVNMATGSVSVAAAIAINVKNNYIVEVTATNDGGDHRAFHETIRVQREVTERDRRVRVLQLDANPGITAYRG